MSPPEVGRKDWLSKASTYPLFRFNSSKTDSGLQRQTEAYKDRQRPTKTDRGLQRRTEAYKDGQRPTKTDRGLYNFRSGFLLLLLLFVILLILLLLLLLLPIIKILLL